jgi:hypothetical protein
VRDHGRSIVWRKKRKESLWTIDYRTESLSVSDFKRAKRRRKEEKWRFSNNIGFFSLIMMSNNDEMKSIQPIIRVLLKVFRKLRKHFDGQ